MTPFEPTRAPQGASGFLMLAHNTNMKIYTPNWHEPTYFLPVGSPQQGMSNTDDDNWYHRVPDLIRFTGTRRQVSFLNTPSDMTTDDLEPTPYDLLRQTTWTMSTDTHPHWQPLFRWRKHRRPALPNPTWAVLMQGMLYGYPKMSYWRAPISGAVMLLTPSQAMAVQKLLHDDDAAEQLFDPGTDSGGPNLLRFYRHPRHDWLPADWSLVRESPTCIPTGDSQGKPRLLCEMIRPANGGYISCPSPVDRALALKPWGTVIRRLTVAEQLRCLSTAFEAELIRAVFRGTRYEPDLPQWLTDVPEPQPVW